ncbi:MAG: ribonuclease P protein component [Proteobacteria bacterium]|nr:ribonuclease P protein component [Pseudomonadota bacterium]
MLNSLFERLRKRSDFVTVAKAGERYVTPAFIIQAYKRAIDGPFRTGITASRKVGKAVERNRAKRRLRVLIRTTFPHTGHAGMDYVLIAREEALKRNFALMEKELVMALLKLHKRLES